MTNYTDDTELHRNYRANSALRIVSIVVLATIVIPVSFWLFSAGQIALTVTVSVIGMFLIATLGRIETKYQSFIDLKHHLLTVEQDRFAANLTPEQRQAVKEDRKERFSDDSEDEVRD